MFSRFHTETKYCCPVTLGLGEIADIGEFRVWGLGSKVRTPGQIVWGLRPIWKHKKLKAFRCISGNFLYFLTSIVKIQHIDVKFTVTART